MGALQCTRAADAVGTESKNAGGITLDASQVLGTWVNTNVASRGIIGFVLTEDQNSLMVRVYGAGAHSPIDWGQVKVESTFASQPASEQMMAFTATYDFGFAQVELQGNTNLGLFVIAGFNTFKDGSRRSNYFSREFFYRSEAGPSLAEPPEVPDDGLQYVKIADWLQYEANRSDADSINVTPLLGTWMTTNGSSKGIGKLIIAHDDGVPVISAFGAWPDKLQDWGTVKARLFADNGADSLIGRAISAVYDFGFMESQFQIKIKKGTLVAAGFNRFKDGSNRSNYFSREFFYRA